MQTIDTIEQGVQAVFKDRGKEIDKQWKYLPAQGEELVDILVVDGEEIPLFWWRYDNQVFPLKNKEQNMDSVSCKLNTVSSKVNGLDRLLIRHFDIAEWFLKSSVRKLNCYRKGNSAEVLLTMENEKVAMVELAATLGENANEQGRMTIWGKKGMASNRVVSQKDMPQSIYVYDSEGNLQTYNDLCITLYGLSRMQVIKVAAITDVLCGNYDVAGSKQAMEKYKRYLDYSKRSAEENKPYFVKGE